MVTGTSSETDEWYIPGVVTEATPSLSNASRFLSATAVYTSGTFTPYFRAVCCVAGNSGQMYGIIMFHAASTTPSARTVYALWLAPFDCP